MLYRSILTSVFISISVKSFCQDSLHTLSSVYWDHQSSINISLEYQSDNVFLGRKDSISTPYYGLQLGFTFKNGLYFSAKEDYTTIYKGRFDAGTIAAGYNFMQSKNWGGELFAEKYFYNKSSKAVRSEIAAIIGGEVCYENDWITPNLNLNLAFGQKTDIIITPSLNREFEFLNKQLSIAPVIGFSFATQHFLDSYFQRLAKQEGKTKAEKSVLNSGKFNLKTVEISLPITYLYKCWEFSLQPTWILPKNPSEITIGTIILTEKLNYIYLMQAGLKYHFRLNQKS